MPSLPSISKKGGMRAGSGRKAGGQNQETSDRVVISRWFCDWFARELKKKKSLHSKVTDAQCEAAVNDVSPPDEPVFSTEKIQTGCRWQQARSGYRPFDAKKLAAVALAAERLGFWSQAWRTDATGYSADDKKTLFILALIAVDGFVDEKSMKTKFAELHRKLLKAVKKLSDCETEAKFENARKKCIEAMQAWSDFADDLPQTVGSIGLRPDLEASFGDWATDVRNYTLKPQQALIALQLFKFGAANRRIQRLGWQVWSLYFEESFMFNMDSAKNHIRQTIISPESGTKLAQLARETSKNEKSRIK